jgi:uncharacterized protein YegP (UPF0339 family)
MFEVYRDARGEFRWRLKDGNHRIIAASAEGYVSRDGATRAVQNGKYLAPAAQVVDR